MVKDFGTNEYFVPSVKVVFRLSFGVFLPKRLDARGPIGSESVPLVSTGKEGLGSHGAVNKNGYRINSQKDDPNKTGQSPGAFAQWISS
jgi:hypothetical protein